MEEITSFEAHTSYVISLIFTRDGKTLISSGMDNLVKLWDAANWQLADTFAGPANSVNSMALSPDGKMLSIGAADKKIRVWDLR